jgi:hypothetical protein
MLTIVAAIALLPRTGGAEPLRPFACATGYTNLAQDVVWPSTQGTNKASAYLARVVFRCYKKPAGPEREACIQYARDRHYVWTLAFDLGVPQCLDKAAIMDSTVARMRAFADRIYCDGGSSRCQHAAARLAGDFAIRMIGLHMGYWQDLWKGVCCQKYEDTAIAKFNNKLKRLPQDCPPCFDMTTFATDFDQDVDAHNEESYCASESERR